jgi:Flp pilus assembly pilin Flp
MRQWMRNWTGKGWRRKVRDDTGSATAEYAIATLAAVGFAGLLVVILRSDAVRQMLTDLIHRALTFAG